MSGWTDIDGSQIMAGSPGLMECAEVELRLLLGEFTHVRESALHRAANLQPEATPHPTAAAECVTRAKAAFALVGEARRVLAGEAQAEELAVDVDGKRLTYSEIVALADTLEACLDGGGLSDCTQDSMACCGTHTARFYYLIPIVKALLAELTRSTITGPEIRKSFRIEGSGALTFDMAQSGAVQIRGSDDLDSFLREHCKHPHRLQTPHLERTGGGPFVVVYECACGESLLRRTPTDQGRCGQHLLG